VIDDLPTGGIFRRGAYLKLPLSPWCSYFVPHQLLTVPHQKPAATSMPMLAEIQQRYTVRAHDGIKIQCHLDVGMFHFRQTGWIGNLTLDTRRGIQIPLFLASLSSSMVAWTMPIVGYSRDSSAFSLSTRCGSICAVRSGCPISYLEI
jgi:hypothetical protein